MSTKKKTARETLAALRDEGLHLVMLTGDNEGTARAIGAVLGPAFVIGTIGGDLTIDLGGTTLANIDHIDAGAGNDTVIGSAGAR